MAQEAADTDPAEAGPVEAPATAATRFVAKEHPRILGAQEDLRLHLTAKELGKW